MEGSKKEGLLESFHIREALLIFSSRPKTVIAIKHEITGKRKEDARIGDCLKDSGFCFQSIQKIHSKETFTKRFMDRR